MTLAGAERLFPAPIVEALDRRGFRLSGIEWSDLLFEGELVWIRSGLNRDLANPIPDLLPHFLRMLLICERVRSEEDEDSAGRELWSEFQDAEIVMETVAKRLWEAGNAADLSLLVLIVSFVARECVYRVGAKNLVDMPLDAFTILCRLGLGAQGLDPVLLQDWRTGGWNTQA